MKNRNELLKHPVESRGFLFPFAIFSLSPSPPPPIFEPATQVTVVQKAGIAILRANKKEAYRFEGEDEI